MNPKWKKVGWILLHVALFIPFALLIQRNHEAKADIWPYYPINFYFSLFMSVILGLMLRKHKGAPLALMCLVSCLHINTILVWLGAPVVVASVTTMTVSIAIAMISVHLILSYGKKHDIAEAKKLRQSRHPPDNK